MTNRAKDRQGAGVRAALPQTDGVSEHLRKVLDSMADLSRNPPRGHEILEDRPGYLVVKPNR